MSLEKKLAAALPIACNAAISGGEFLAKKFGKIRNLETKADTSLVSEADKGSEKLVLGAIRKKFPGDTIIGEETGLTEGDAGNGFRWHIDPLDGTTNYVHGFPFFCVSIGLEFERRELVLGVIYQPITQTLYCARRGKGAFRNKKRMRVSKTRRLENALLSTGFSMRRRQLFKSEMAAFERLTAASHAVRRTGSAALDLVHVATGQFDGFWEQGLKTWDTAAGLTLIAEAGGAFSRLDGRNFRLGDDSVLASNGLIHQEMVAAARS